MVEMFPNLLSLDTDAQIMPVLYFLQVTPLKPQLEVEVGCSRVHGHLLGSHAHAFFIFPPKNATNAELETMSVCLRPSWT
jgi:hypothetical protein